MRFVPQAKLKNSRRRPKWTVKVYHIEDLEQIETSVDQFAPEIPLDEVDYGNNDLLRLLRDSGTLMNHFNTATGKIAQERFDALEEGGNFHTLPDELKSTYSDGKRTQSTIYLKLKYDEPSGTVVNVRKSMWVHPAVSRTLSVREAARLQTFPDSFVFMGTKDSHEDAPEKDKILIEMITDPEATQMEFAERAGISQSAVSMNTKRMISEEIRLLNEKTVETVALLVKKR